MKTQRRLRALRLHAIVAVGVLQGTASAEAMHRNALYEGSFTVSRVFHT